MVKTISLILVGIIIGALLFATPDIVSLTEDYIIHKYSKSECMDKGIDRDRCEFNMYFPFYEKDHPILSKVGSYFIMDEGFIYYVISGRCSNKPMHNVSALGDETGKISMRDYFRNRCGQFAEDLSDLIFGDGDKE